MYTLGVSPHLFKYGSLYLLATECSYKILFKLFDTQAISCSLSFSLFLSYMNFTNTHCDIASDWLNSCGNIRSFNLWFLAVLDLNTSFVCMHEHILHEDMSKSFDFTSARYVGPVKKKRRKKFVFKLQLSHFALFCELFRGFSWEGGLRKGKSGFVPATHGRNLYYVHGWFISVSSFNILTPMTYMDITDIEITQLFSCQSFTIDVM